MDRERESMNGGPDHARERAIHDYVTALDSGDLEAVAAALAAAESDPELDRILNEIHHSYAVEESFAPLAIPARFVHRLIRSKNAARRDPKWWSSLKEGITIMRNTPILRKSLPVLFALMLCAGLFGAVQLFHHPAPVTSIQSAVATHTVPAGLSPLDTRVMGQRSWLRGGPAALRVIVTDHRTGAPVNARVVLTLTRLVNGRPGGGAYTLFSGPTDRFGTLDASFRAPNAPAGDYRLAVQIRSALGEDHAVQTIQLQESALVLLTSDKPVYQPGQTIHLRALALDMATRTALAKKPILFEVEDGRGNKVFKQRETLSTFGIASADFELADEVNLGTFTLRAVLPSEQLGGADNTVEKTVSVERYVLPKFKLTITTQKPYYLPGEKIHGSVQASYFFGQPVAHGRVTIAVRTVDIGVHTLATLHGITDSAGFYHFDCTLPSSLIGQPFEQGKAVVELDATVQDTADQSQGARIEVPVVPQPILLAIVPESSSLTPGVQNGVYLAAAEPDGSPIPGASIEVTARLSGGSAITRRRLITDEMGLAEFRFTPAGGQYVIEAQAADSQGHRVAQTGTIGSGSPGGILLQPDRTLARVGERLSFTILSPAKIGAVYLDILRDRQTIVTRAADLTNGRAVITVPATPEMVGTLEVHAYRIQPDEQIVRDNRTIIVSPADDLNIQVSTDQSRYRPGGEALVRLAVTDNNRRPVPSAIGMAVVDESVFALSELKPGLEKIYFTLEKELMTPKYQINGLSPAGLLMGGTEDEGRRTEDGGRGAGSPSRLGEGSGERSGARGVGEQSGKASATDKDEGRRMNDESKTPQSRRPFPSRGGAGGEVAGDAARQRAAAMLLASSADQVDYDFNVDTYSDRWAKYQAMIQAEMSRAAQKIANAVQVYRHKTGRALTARQSLFYLVDHGILKLADLKDHWGRFYRTQLHGRTTYGYYIYLESAGPDGRWGDADDFTTGSGVFDADRAVFFGRGQMFADAAVTEARAGFGAAVPTQVDLVENRTVLARTQVAFAARSATMTPSAPPTHSAGSLPPARIRQYFPETMFWNPAIITDNRGEAQIRLPLADSITTWRLSLLANSVQGQLGSATDPIRVFQDFFVDLDLPLSLTQHDRIGIPVSIYNYLPVAQDVTLTLEPQPWFTLKGPSRQTIHVAAGQVTVVYYPIIAQGIGMRRLTVTARGSRLSDAVQRSIHVMPDGKEIDTAAGDRLDAGNRAARQNITLPAAALSGASKLYLKLFPGAFSQIVDGMDSLLQMPYGCFEQTSSTTYPDVLALAYLKATRKTNPAIRVKAEDYINLGYQRLLTFECKGGGFSWFGTEPANQILTAYGLLEFSDMAKVHDVDPDVIARTQQWLAAQQRSDGSWLDTTSGIQEGIINRQTGALRSTAYVCWALAESGFHGPALNRGLAFVRARMGGVKDSYTLAVILNLFAAVNPDGSAASNAAQRLMALAKTGSKDACWTGSDQTFTGARGDGADIETTGLATYALLRWGHASGFTNRALAHLARSKNSDGDWGSTQGTVWSLKALLYASEHGTGSAHGTVTVTANGRPAGAIVITADNDDLMRQIDLSQSLHTGANSVTLRFRGSGSMNYQVVERYYLPWGPFLKSIGHSTPAAGPLTLKVAYNRTTLARNDTARETVTIHNITRETVEMPLIDVGTPPGFTVLPDALDAAQSDGRISKYSIAARQVIIYLEKLSPGQTVTITYTIRARFPVRAQTPSSRAYPYYNPNQSAIAPPQEMVVL